MSDTPADLLRKARLKLGFKSAAAAARSFGWNVSTYTSSENGTRPISKRLARVYAQALGLSEARLLEIAGKAADAGDVEFIDVFGGQVAMGVWKEARLRAEKGDRVGIPRGRRSAPLRRAVPVGDESVNLAISSGELAVYVEWADGDVLAAGSLVYVERTRGELFERSIRRVEQVSESKFKLTAFSNVPRFADAIPYPPRPGETVQIIGRVIGKYVEFE